MKTVGGLLIVIGVYLGMAVHPLFFLGSAIGLLIYLQGVENAVIAHTTEYVRRAITENKTYDEIEEERLAGN
jgi:hypothetical protein